MTTVAEAPAPPSSADPTSAASGDNPRKILVPYLVAIGSQLPMLYLYYRNLTSQPHYQPFLIAVIACIAIALMRWPFGHEKPFHRSLAADIMIVLGLLSAAMGLLFVEPWFAALAAMLFVTSLLARTLDKESLGTLWPCALPLYVYLALPMGMDVRLITTLQAYSAKYTSRLLDLAGLGHHMDGAVINVPSLKEYGIEQACSGVQSFFTLLLVAVVFIVLSRRIKVPPLGVSILALMMAALLLVFRITPGLSTTASQFLLLGSAGLALFAFLGFRSALLILSAVFWAVFVNTIRILTIPLSEYFAGIDLSEGISHDLLGYTALAIGIVMLMSTDQFLLFLFGPVEDAEDSGPFGSVLGGLWNGLAGKEQDESGRRKQPKRRSPGASDQRFLWIFAGLMVVMGLWQIVDVQRSFASTDKSVRFFDSDMTVEFGESDVPPSIGTWQRANYVMQNRSIGSDLGERSDVWQFSSTTAPLTAVASLDQTFPGWHELTTCYRNMGWTMKVGGRRATTPRAALGLTSDEDPEEGVFLGDEEWGMVEANLEKPTGEQAFLLFSHFDSFGDGLEVPRRWGSLNSLFIRAGNRLSHRIRARLLRGEAYQFQVLVTSYSDIPPEVKQEVRQQFLRLREHLREQFLAKQKSDS